MAGHFLLPSMPRQQLLTASMVNVGVSGRMHGAIGWNAGSRAALTAANNGTAADRNGLPPHHYMTFGPLVNGNAADDKTATYVRFSDWAGQVTRPAGYFLTGLCPAATALWNANDKAGAVLAQARHGGVSIEYYHVDGEEV
jgi:hypothetical protein